MKHSSNSRFGVRKFLLGMRWHVARAVNARTLQEMLGERGVNARRPGFGLRLAGIIPQPLQTAQLPGCRSGILWRLDERRVKGAEPRKYLYRAVDQHGNTVDFLLSAKRDHKAAARFLQRVIGRRNRPAAGRPRGRSKLPVEYLHATHGPGILREPLRRPTGIVDRGTRTDQRFARPKQRRVRKLVWGSLVLLAACAAWLVVDELQTSRLQAWYFAGRARNLAFPVEPGPAPEIHLPRSGPYDARLGYSQLPAFLKSLAARGYVVSKQARISPQLAELTQYGLSPVYREKDQAGLTLLDCGDRELYSARFPERVYARFEDIPPLLVNSLLFIEDQELLDARHPERNPALEWKRFTLAAFDQLWHIVDPSRQTPGASTLATQIEKYRHSPEGRTLSPREKLRQMAAASARAYLDGENTLAARRRIVVSYLNTVPLAAKPSYGEINSLGDGLWAWYGRDFADVNRLLRDVPETASDSGRLPARAQAFKQALSLMIAQRRPSYYLGEGKGELQELTNSYLRLLAAAGIVPPALRDAALPVELIFRNDVAAAPPISFVTRKAVTAMRTHLSGLLSFPRLYDLDRLDLTAASTLAGEIQYPVTDVLRALHDPATAKARGLYGFRMLNPGDDPGHLTFSFTLFERTGSANLLRVQTDNFDQPFDINEGAKLNLGSTAKLRTLILYLEIIADLHRRYVGLSRRELSTVEGDRRDVLTRWALDYLSGATDRSLRAMLEAAMERRYNASPAEAFFTGGGLQTFENFDPAEDRQVMPVREAFKQSVNLVFVRLMRDIVRHYIYRRHDAATKLLEDSADPRRRELLSRFADREGRTFINRFYRKYRGKTAAEAWDLLLESIRPTPRRLAVLFRTIEPEAGLDLFSAFLQERAHGPELTETTLRRLYEDYRPDKFSLVDRGFLARVHPLELWTVAYLRRHPGATLSQVVEVSRQERQDVYVWLFKTRHKNAQDTRIGSLLEVEAFLDIARDWRRLGYPFQSLTPSYATAIGASGDRPAALAALVGIIVNKGVRLPVVRVENLRFAAATPFETMLEYRPGEPERVLPEELAEIVRRSLVEVVQEGTARRLAGGFVLADGRKVVVGGKTGTGDHRYQIYGRGGRRIATRIVNRSATFVFLIGDRYFGTLTAYVHEPYAAKYRFTSALAVQLLKSLAPALMPLMEDEAGSGHGVCRR